MINNKLYPYIKKCINEYLWGITNEQIEIGVFHDSISLENMHLKPDIINSKLNSSEIPLWLKAGRIGKIKVGCSLMNFIGEKPLEVNIDDIDLVFCPSYKYIFKNRRDPIRDSELKQDYDPVRFNSNNIFERKIKIYNGSVLNTSNDCNCYQDKTKLSKAINQLLSLCIKFYTMKPYTINANITNVHIRFEDDELIFQAETQSREADAIEFGVIINTVKVSMASEGMLKKNSLSMEEMRFYYDTKPTIFIPTDFFLKSLDKQGFIIDESYYSSICKINFRELLKKTHKAYIIELKSIKGTFGMKSTDKATVNIFNNQDANNMTVHLDIAIIDPLIIHIKPQFINSLKAVLMFTKDFRVLQYANDFKPLYAPFVCNKSIRAYFLDQDDRYFRLKKKKVVRDWLFYFFWFKQFKTVFESSSSLSSCSNTDRGQVFRNAFNRYMNIIVLNKTKVKTKTINEDVQIIQPNHNIKSYCINNKAILEAKNESQDSSQYSDFSFKSALNIQLNQIKGYVHDDALQQMNSIQNQAQACMIEINNNSFEMFISKNQFRCEYSFKNLVIETKETYKTSNKEIPKHETLINLKQARLLKTKLPTSSNLNSSPSNNTAALTIIPKLPYHNLNIPKYNTNYDISAGLKVSPLVEETQAIQKSNINTFQQQARSAKRMKILCDTLHVSNNATKHIHPLKTNNHSQQKNKDLFILSLLNSNEECSKPEQEREEEKLRTEVSISKAIKEYNSKKNKMLNKSMNNSVIGLNQSINPAGRGGGRNEDNSNNIISFTQKGFLNKSVNANNNAYKSIFSIVNNKIKQIKENFPLSLLSIALNDSKEFACKFSFKKNNSSRAPDLLSLSFGNIRLNVFAAYLQDLIDIINSFDIGLTIANITKFDQTQEMKDKKHLFLMKKYIYRKCLKNLRNNPNDLLEQYTQYIKGNCMTDLIQEEDLGDITQNAFDLCYFFSHYFSQGIEIELNYNRIDVLCYNREQTINDLLARAKVPPINFRLELTLSNIFLQLFDFEFDINDYDSITETVNDIVEAFNLKFRKAKKVIEPALNAVKNLIMKEKEDENLKTTNFGLMKKNNNSSYVYNKTLSQPVNIKILHSKDDLNNPHSSAYDSNFYQNRSCTVNDPQQYNLKTKTNNNAISNTISLLKTSERDNIMIIYKNPID